MGHVHCNVFGHLVVLFSVDPEVFPLFLREVLEPVEDEEGCVRLILVEPVQLFGFGVVVVLE